MKFQSESRRGMMFVSYLDYTDLRDGVQAFSWLAASARALLDVTMRGEVDSQRLQGEFVTTNYFSTFGATPAPGNSPSAVRSARVPPASSGSS